MAVEIIIMSHNLSEAIMVHTLKFLDERSFERPALASPKHCDNGESVRLVSRQVLRLQGSRKYAHCDIGTRQKSVFAYM